MTPDQVTSVDWSPLFNAIVGGGVLVIGALAAFIVKRLEENTKITKDVQRQTNGERTRLVTENQTLRSLVQTYREVMREIKSTPAGADMLRQIADRRRTVVRDEDVEALERRLAGEEAPRDR